MMKRIGLPLLLSLFLLLGCCPERDPFAYAPTCSNTAWTPCKVPCFPVCSENCFPIFSDPAACPEAGQTLTLADLVDIALQNSPDTRETWANARIAAAELGIGRSEYYPEVTGSAEVTNLREAEFFGSSELTRNSYTQYGPEIQVNYLVWDFGARSAKVQALCQSLMQANFSHNREIQTVIQQIANDYYEVLGQQEQVRASLADVADAQINFEATRKKRIAGVSDLSDELMAKAQLSQVELQLLENEQLLEEAQGSLANELGLPATLDLELQQMPERIPVKQLTESVEQLICQAYNYRPDLFAAQANVRSRVASLKKARRNEMPKLQFNGDIGTTWFNSGVNDTYDYVATLQVSVPIFRGFYYWNKIRQAKAQLEKSRAKLRGMEVEMVAEVVTKYKDFVIAGKKVHTAQEYVDASHGSYDSALKKYKAGTVDFVFLSDAFARLADARAALASSRQDWYTSLTDLAYVTGTLHPPRPATCCAKG